MIFFKLFFEFFKIGLFAIGGGMATVPFLFSLGEKTAWFTSSELANMIAVSESTPGPIGINMATYVGFTTAGIAGSFASTLGLVTPSVIIILIVATILEKFKNSPIIEAVFSVLRPSVVGLIGYALWTVARITLFNGNNLLYLNLVIFIILAILIKCFNKVHPIVWIIVGAVCGILFL